MKGLQVPCQQMEDIILLKYSHERDSPSHKNLGEKSGRGLRLINHHLSLLRRKRLFKHNRSSWSPPKKTTNFRPSRIVFSVVILVIDKTRILRFYFRTIIDRKLKRVLFQWIDIIFTFPLLITFQSFIYHSGLDDIDFKGFTSIRCGLRSIFTRSIKFLLRKGHGRLLRR